MQMHLPLNPNSKPLPLLFIPNTISISIWTTNNHRWTGSGTGDDLLFIPNTCPSQSITKNRWIGSGTRFIRSQNWCTFRRCQIAVALSSTLWIFIWMYIEVYFTHPFTGRILKFPSLDGDKLYPDEEDLKLPWLTPEVLEASYFKPDEHIVFKAIMLCLTNT